MEDSPAGSNSNSFIKDVMKKILLVIRAVELSPILLLQE